MRQQINARKKEDKRDALADKLETIFGALCFVVCFLIAGIAGAIERGTLSWRAGATAAFCVLLGAVGIVAATVVVVRLLRR